MAEDSQAQWLYAMDVEHRIPHRLSNSVDEQFFSVEVSSSQPQRLIFTKATPRASLHTLPLSGQLQTWKDAKPFDELNRVNTRVLAPRYAPVHAVGDPEYLLFLSSKGGRDGLWKWENGKEPKELWKGTEGGVVAPPAISRNGRQICFSYRKEGRSSLYVMDSDRGTPRPLADSMEVRGPADWSPDGKFVVVTAVRKGELVPRVFKVPVGSGGKAVPLVDDLSYNPIWSPDDTFVLYSVPGDQGSLTYLKAVTPNGDPVNLPPMDLYGSPGITYRFLPGRKTIIVLVSNKDTGRQEFRSVDLVTGQMNPVADLSVGVTFRNFDISPDGKTILFEHVENNADIWMATLPES
jgi:Tol biopolymer transport system component